MTNKKLRLYIIIASTFFLQLFHLSVFSQTATLSPYSRYGIGDMIFNGYTHQRAMAGLSVGLQQSTYINFGNPASYVADSIVIFQLGLTGEIVRFSNQTDSKKKTNGDISYLSMGFPLIKNYLYLNVGMLPFSAAGFKVQQASSLNDSIPGNAKFIYEGSGGYNRFYGGMGVKLFHHLSAGVNASYLFGSATNTSKVEFKDAGYINTKLIKTITLGDVFFEGGLQYVISLPKEKHLTLGVTGSPAQNISAKRDFAWINYIYNIGNAIDKDIVLFTEKEKGTIKIPIQAGFGFTLSKKENWLVGADFKMIKWEDFKSYGLKDSLKNSYKITIGGQWVPDAISMRYFGRAIYRAGVSYNKGNLELKNEAINDVGISFGAGFPLRGKPYFSHLDLSFELGQRGTTKNNLVREQYGRVTIGLTIREDWFHKPKFD